MLLFEPYHIGELELKNRFLMAPMSLNLCKDGYVTEKMICFFEQRAKGGVGLIVIGDGIVDVPVGNNVKESLGIDDDKYLPGLKELTRAVQKHDCKIAMQLSHGGRRAGRVSKEGYLDVTRGIIPVAPSSLPHPVPGQVVPRELSKEEILEIVDAFIQGAIRSEKAGFDAIGLHCAHMYLCGEFLSPWSNIRTDEYGGDMEGRLKFVLDIIHGLKNAVSKKIPLMIRINGEEPEGGNSLEDIRVISKRMEAAGADALHVSVGFGAPTKTHGLIPSVTPMRAKPGTIVHLAENVKTAVSIPVIAVNKLGNVNLAESVLKENRADMIGLGRPLIADPDLPNKAKAGKIGEIRPCINCCQGCIGNILEKDIEIACSINPFAGREMEMILPETSVPKKVLVVGGGPAGLYAGIEAAQKGHDVYLVEKGATLGGQLLLASKPPGKSDIEPYCQYLMDTFESTGSKLFLNQEVSEALIDEIKPDAAIIATGSRPIDFKLPGMDENTVIDARKVLDGEGFKAKTVTVIGGGQVGCEVAELLSKQGKTVTIVEIDNDIVREMSRINRLPLIIELENDGVQILTKTRAESVTDKGLWVNFLDQKKFVESKAIVVAVGAEPNTTDAEKLLTDKKIKLYFIGDRSNPGSILDAIRDGFDAACEL